MCGEWGSRTDGLLPLQYIPVHFSTSFIFVIAFPSRLLAAFGPLHSWLQKTRHTSRPSDLHHDAHQASLLATESDRSPVHTPDSGESFCSALGPARVTFAATESTSWRAVRLREHLVRNRAGMQLRSTWHCSLSPRSVVGSELG